MINNDRFGRGAGRRRMLKHGAETRGTQRYSRTNRLSGNGAAKNMVRDRGRVFGQAAFIGKASSN
jgi:hypothetical protein